MILLAWWEALTCVCSFINTVAGWVNLLLLSSSGPVKIPVGAWYVPM